jgi:hypothetical protein
MTGWDCGRRTCTLICLLEMIIMLLLLGRESANKLAEMLRTERPKGVVRYTMKDGLHQLDGLGNLEFGWVTEWSL